MNITDKQLQLIEKLGLAFEAQGLQPAVARVEAVLIVSDKVELTFDEIKDILKLSKSATSNAINMLLNINRIEYITKPGDRKRYFKTKIVNWKTEAKNKLMDVGQFKSIIHEVLEQRPESTKEFNDNLAEFLSMFEYVTSQIPLLFKAWEDKNK